MGNFLDLLLGTRVQADGDELEHRKWINFRGFTVEDDEANDRIIVESSVEFDGDVELNEEEENIVRRISGDEDGFVVEMRAVGMQWSVAASPTEPAIIIGEEGSLELWDDGVRVIAAEAAGPVLGNSTARTHIVGGLRLTRQFINTSPVTLDTTSKATLLVIEASLERTVNLPAAPADGGIWFWVLVGGTSNITFGRSGCLINGAASNYAPADSSRGIIFSDGVDYYTFAGLE